MKTKLINKIVLSTIAFTMLITTFMSLNLQPIEASNTQTVRMYFDDPAIVAGDHTVWAWGDTIDQNSGWPNGVEIKDNGTGSFQYYADIILKENAKNLGYLVVDSNGIKITEDNNITIISDKLAELYIGRDYEFHYSLPTVAQNKLRIHYLSGDGDYTRDHLYGYGILNVGGSNNWGTFLKIDTTIVGPNGVSADFDVNPDLIPSETGSGFFTLVPSNDGNRSHEYRFKDIPKSREFYVREGDTTLYDNPFYARTYQITGGELISDSQIALSFNDNTAFNVDTIKESIKFYNGKDLIENPVFEVVEKDGKFYLNGAFDTMTITHLEMESTKVSLSKSWRYIDGSSYYEDDLGATLHADGSATLKVWSPSASSVRVILYDKTDQTKVLFSDLAMTKEAQGVWTITLNEQNTGISDLNNYVYHYAIERNDETFITLDPYAKSLSQWNSSNEEGHKIAKAAIVNPSNLGPKLDYANIKGYETREDAIIYELHVRDFTSDPTLDTKLKAQYGTFAAFIEKLDYIQELGITHIQLLPVMSYYFSNEFNTQERMLEYQSSNTDYNWGYDPQSYFALTGMYSEEPSNPEKRIEEFKLLVDAIHARGMGVILDVVYNHTAQVSIFEDLEPNYYHFMDADGTPRTSFGGGRLGTTHAMSRRVLVDSILYLVEEYKVDGFRFDMMGDHDAETIQIAYDEAKKINPKVLMIGEGWVTYAGDEGSPVQAADQQWMQYTQAVGSFSDEIRNELKSGFGSEGQPRFLTNGPRSIEQIFQNMIANPGNFKADDPGDVVQYIEAHDNLTLYDVIAQSIKKDPAKHDAEILQRVRLGNTMILTSQGTTFLHGGQEYGRTKQYLAPTDTAPYKSTHMVNEDGTPFVNPYFIHDSYDSSDIINRFDWTKASDETQYPLNNITRKHMAGMIALRRSTDAFTYSTMEDINSYVSKIESKDIEDRDLVVGMKNISKETGAVYYTLVNADSKERTINFDTETINLEDALLLSDGMKVNLDGITSDLVQFDETSVKLSPLSSIVIKVQKKDPVTPKPEPELPITPVEPQPEQPTVTPNPEKPLPETGITAQSTLYIAFGLILTGFILRKRFVHKKEN